MLVIRRISAEDINNGFAILEQHFIIEQERLRSQNSAFGAERCHSQAEWHWESFLISQGLRISYGRRTTVILFQRVSRRWKKSKLIKTLKQGYFRYSYHSFLKT